MPPVSEASNYGLPTQGDVVARLPTGPQKLLGSSANEEVKGAPERAVNVVLGAVDLMRDGFAS
jgi:hypothetical protein